MITCATDIRITVKKKVEIKSDDSLGFKIIRMMAEQMESELSIWTEKGLRLEMKIPLS